VGLLGDKKALSVGIILGGVVFSCICCLLAVGGSAYLIRDTFVTVMETLEAGGSFTYEVVGSPTPTPYIIRPTGSSPTQMELGDATLFALGNSTPPLNDRADLAKRLLGVGTIPETYPDPNAPHQVGDQQSFWVTDTSTDAVFLAPATLRYMTEHAYFWVGDSVRCDDDDLKDLAEAFENHIYPTTRAFFGSEWTPGIDEDERIYILYVLGVGSGVAGYFSSSDQVHPLAHEHSNGHELFVFNAGNTSLSSRHTYGLLAHEFQHMIHWNQDRNEVSWVNEGFSELAVLLNGYSPGGFDFLYISQPDLQLNDWPNDDMSTGPHYGAAFLFMTYFLDRMGDGVTKMLVEHPENGLKSIDLVLAEANAMDPLTGQPIRANDLVLDWVLTNYLLDENVGDGRFTYDSYHYAIETQDTETFDECLPGLQERNVRQYGVDYIRFTCPGRQTLTFEGSLHTTLLPESAHSGDYSFWSGKGDESDMTLTRTFDFTAVTAPITLSYWTWYDIEEDYDYVFLTASVDGEHWDILTTPSGTGEDPTGGNYGWGYNGLSGGSPEWIQESVDLSQYAGQKVQLRFEYVTDAAVNGEGFLLDDLAIPAVEYFTDFEEDDGGWFGAGFVRVANILPQTFRLALITKGSMTDVKYIALDSENSLEIPFEIGGDVDEVILVVVGTTRYTRQLASYQFQFLP
jgi:immune inhibitor A